MKKLSTKQKKAWNNLSKKRHAKYLKRRPHVLKLKAAERRINTIQRKMARIMYYRRKYSQPQQPTGKVL